VNAFVKSDNRCFGKGIQMGRVVLLALALAVFVSAASVVQTGENSGSGIATVPPQVSQQSICANGVVEGRTREAMLRFEISSRLASVKVHDGDRVRKGDTLAELDATTWLCELAKAEASLALQQAEREHLINGARTETRAFARAQHHAAQARMVQADKRADRGIRLQQRDALSQQDLDDLVATAEANRAEVDAFAARADELEAPAREDELRMVDAKIALETARVRQARAMLEKTELKAPFDGIVLRVRGEVGELTSDTDPPTITLADTSEMHVRAYVEEMYALAVTEGQRGYVTTDGCTGVRFSGTVVSCTPYMSPKKLIMNTPGERIDVKVREVVLRLDDQDKLVVGCPVNVFIESEK
jgi:HlyD family secretion protein